jgi:hypothetical protein
MLFVSIAIASQSFVFDYSKVKYVKTMKKKKKNIVAQSFTATGCILSTATFLVLLCVISVVPPSVSAASRLQTLLGTSV